MDQIPISSIQQYAPGIRFHPSDEELIIYYLQRKVKSLPLPANVITDIELYSYDPWDLPKKALFGDVDWYFFTPRDRKYPNGGRPNRMTESGYWKATGSDKPIISLSGSRRIGVKKVLVFYKGKPPKGVKMDWIMTEYRLPDASCPSRSKGSMRSLHVNSSFGPGESRCVSQIESGTNPILVKNINLGVFERFYLDDWVLCRIQQKRNMSKNEQHNAKNSCEFPQYQPKIKEPSSLCTESSRDKLADYLLSSEHHLIASLLIGHDPRLVTIPKTTSQSHKRGNNIRIIREATNSGKTDMTMNKQKDGTSRSEQMVTNSYCPHVYEGNKFKPNYSSNTYVNLEELDMPALWESLQ